VREFVGKISTSGEEVLALIAQFLSKSKMELGQIIYDPVNFDLAAVTREIAEGMARHAEHRGLAFNIGIGEDARLPVRADINKVKEAIRNIVDNAIKYTRAGSVTVAAGLHDGKVRVSVTDTGAGIAPEAVSQLFKKFSRADAQRANLQGSGIGLYLAGTFIEAQGGSISAFSEGQGKGSVFTIELPLRGDGSTKNFAESL
jgi:signal transduction histidine kinase